MPNVNGKVVAICISPVAGNPMQRVQEVEAVTGSGLKGDRYAVGNGSFNRGSQGKRQITLINAIFFKNSGFEYEESRRNLVVEGVELNWLVNREFQVGGAVMRGVKYCDPCLRPSKLIDKVRSFKEAFFDRGGIIAEVIQGGIIFEGDPVITPTKDY